MQAREPTLTLEEHARINALAASFERGLRSGNSLRIEDLIAEHDDIRSPLLAKLISVELKWQRENDSYPDRDQFCERFPDERELIEQIFKDRAGIDAITEIDDRLDRKIDSHGSTFAVNTPDLTCVGRYQIERKLGQGGFGVVYLARDPMLDRHVALKMPLKNRIRSSRELTSLINEARNVAKLKHPLLVAVYDVQELDGVPYVIQEFIDGEELGAWVKKHNPTIVELVKIFVKFTDAIAFAHQHGLTHCDLKLSNVLMDTQGQPHVADFGLAVRENLQELRRGQRFGTSHMMAPEQVRCEGHRLDGRTDIWSVGVMMYQLFVSRNPFTGDKREDLFDAILNHDPKPLRQFDRSLPRELERICLKCLSKRRTDRYNTADDLQEDLQAWLNQSATSFGSSKLRVADWNTHSGSASSFRSDHSLRIVPKGLRSFDADDSEFFLDLLPGPKHRDGLPESLRFWKKRIEEPVAEETFSVALIYGPSGCGKSSLVKAGLLPNLSSKVSPIYVEATADNTEHQIVHQIRKLYPELPTGLDLAETLEALRLNDWCGRRKLLLVIDQFEQWLHAQLSTKDLELTRALRQCDGGQLQCMLLVRDDFYLAVNRFFQELEIELQEGRNYRVVDLFDRDHARKLLIAIGQAYGKLGPDLSEHQEQFLTQAIDELAIDGKVICVRLALFGDMMKSREFTPDSLKEVGGVEGLGVTFLEETFSSQLAPPARRVNEQEFRKVLGALLPDAGTDIKGSMRSLDELRDAAEFQHGDRRFFEVIRILDSELRLITPTDPASLSPAQTTEHYYQLAHDYIVPSIRHWLVRRQKESWRGRQELRLAELAAEWNRRPDNRRLPTTYEHLCIRLGTELGNRSTSEANYLEAAKRYHLSRWAIALMVLLIALLSLNRYASSKHELLVSLQEASNKQQSQLLLDRLFDAPAAAVPYAIENLQAHHDLAMERLRANLANAQCDDAKRLRSAVALAEFGTVDQACLIQGIRDDFHQECGNIVRAMAHDRTNSIAALNELYAEAEAASDHRLESRVAICLLLLNEPAHAVSQCEQRPDLVERSMFVKTIEKWHANIQQLVEAASIADNDELRSSICLGVGQVPFHTIELQVLDDTCETFTQWYETEPNAGLHSAAYWVLDRWKRTPDLPAPRDANSTSRDWRVNAVGMTMINVSNRWRPVDVKSAGEVLCLASTIEPTLWVCDREVSTELFNGFMQDSKYPVEMKPSEWPGADNRRSPFNRSPVQSVSWFEAVMFCNWLSTVDGAQPCYLKLKSNWELVQSTGGYRLPTENEWEIACRAGTSTTFSSGEDLEILSDYAVILSHHSEPGATKMPNAWGLFDMHGNVYEWCQDWLLPEKRRRILRSGAFDYEPRNARSDFQQHNLPSYRSFTIGFRVVQQTGAED